MKTEVVSVNNLTSSKRFFDLVYLVYLCFVIIYNVIETINYDFGIISRPMLLVILALSFAIFAKAALEWNSRWSSNDILLLILCVLVLLPTALEYNNKLILMLCVAVLGAKGVSYRKILKCVLAVVAFSVSIVSVLSLAGIIENICTYRDAGNSSRYAMGFNYTTYFSSYLMSIVAIWAFLRNKAIKYIEIGIMIILDVLIIVISQARIDFLTTTLIITALIVSKVENAKSIDIFTFFNKPVKWLLILFCPILAIITFLMDFLYDFSSPFWKIITKILSQRPYYNAITMHRYGFSLFGQFITYHASMDYGSEGIPNYYYIVNNSYQLLFAIVGLFGFFGFLIAWGYLTKKCIIKKNIVWIMVFVSYGCLFFLEQRALEVAINPFILLLFAGDFSEELHIDNKKHKYMLTMIIVAFLVECFVFNYKSVITWADEEIDQNSISYYSDEIIYNENTDLFNITSRDVNLFVSGVYSPLGVDSAVIDLRLYSSDNNNLYVSLKNTDYFVDVYIYDFNEGVYKLYSTSKLNTSRPRSGYISLDIPNAEAFMMFSFHLPSNCQLSIAKMSFNGAYPFDISELRIVLISVLLIILYLIINRFYKKAENERE